MNWKTFFHFSRKRGVTLIVPRAALESTSAALDSYRRQELEGCCFWYGVVENASEWRVVAVIVPYQTNRKGNFHISGGAMKVVSQATLPLGLVNLAQVHTHPDKMVRHSWYDDENVNSRNAFSIIIPNYGSISESWPNDAGIHEFENGKWQFLARKKARERIRLVDGEVRVIDLR